jgi:adenylate cyclase
MSKVLIADDQEINRLLLQNHLQGMGLEVIAVEDGAAALRALTEQSDFDMIFLDIMMPGMSGLEILKVLKAEAGYAHVPVIMISSSVDTDEIAQCLEIGAEDYLQKPFKPAILRARVNASLKQSRHEKKEHQYLEALEQEKSKSTRLLKSLFPEKVLAVLNDEGRYLPHLQENVVVIYTEVDDFSNICKTLPADQLVAGVQEMAMTLEPIADQHGIEQIKLSGCNFTFTAGVLSETSINLATSLRCALAMQSASRGFSSGWKLRIGVACGSVIAGVVGNTRSTFDVWGNPVIQAKRLISYTQPGTVSATRAVWEPVKDKAKGRFHGKAMFEGGKEQLDVYVILSA